MARSTSYRVRTRIALREAKGSPSNCKACSTFIQNKYADWARFQKALVEFRGPDGTHIYSHETRPEDLPEGQLPLPEVQ